MTPKHFIFFVCLLANLAAWASPSDSVIFQVENCYGYYGYIKTNGEFIIEPQFDYAKPFSANGLAVVRIKDKYGYIDKTGKRVIEPQFDWAEDFHFENGLAAIEINGKYGFIDKTGKMVIEPQYVNLMSVPLQKFDGIHVLNKDWNSDTTVFVDERTGKITTVTSFTVMTFFSEGLTVISQKLKYGYADSTGTIVIKPNSKYQHLGDFSEGLAAV